MRTFALSYILFCLVCLSSFGGLLFSEEGTEGSDYGAGREIGGLGGKKEGETVVGINYMR